MKYIRTKDGKIFDTQYEPKAFKYNWNVKFIIDDNNLIAYDTVVRDRIANHGPILKEANDIKELFDVYIVDGIYGPHIYKTWNEVQEIQDECNRNGDYIEIYGAIWAEKEHSFKSVAKETCTRGEFELYYENDVRNARLV